MVGEGEIRFKSLFQHLLLNRGHDVANGNLLVIRNDTLQTIASKDYGILCEQALHSRSGFVVSQVRTKLIFDDLVKLGKSDGFLSLLCTFVEESWNLFTRDYVIRLGARDKAEINGDLKEVHIDTKLNFDREHGLRVLCDDYLLSTRQNFLYVWIVLPQEGTNRRGIGFG